MEGDLRSFRVALTADCYVNPLPPAFDGLAVLAETGWGVVQLPAEDYPAEVARPLLAEVAEQAQEYLSHGYDVVVVGDAPGLQEALAGLGVNLPDRIVPASAGELRDFVSRRPPPPASGLLA